MTVATPAAMPSSSVMSVAAAVPACLRLEPLLVGERLRLAERVLLAAELMASTSEVPRLATPTPPVTKAMSLGLLTFFSRFAARLSALRTRGAALRARRPRHRRAGSTTSSRRLRASASASRTFLSASPFGEQRAEAVHREVGLTRGRAATDQTGARRTCGSPSRGRARPPGRTRARDVVQVESGVPSASYASSASLGRFLVLVVLIETVGFLRERAGLARAATCGTRRCQHEEEEDEAGATHRGPKRLLPTGDDELPPHALKLVAGRGAGGGGRVRGLPREDREAADGDRW